MTVSSTLIADAAELAMLGGFALGGLALTKFVLYALRRAAGPRVVVLVHPPHLTPNGPHIRIGDDVRRPALDARHAATIAGGSETSTNHSSSDSLGFLGCE